MGEINNLRSLTFTISQNRSNSCGFTTHTCARDNDGACYLFRVTLACKGEIVSFWENCHAVPVQKLNGSLMRKFHHQHRYEKHAYIRT